jgi:hypothetical protein
LNGAEENDEEMDEDSEEKAEESGSEDGMDEEKPTKVARERLAKADDFNFEDM